MFTKKKAVLLINNYTENINNFGNLFNELQYNKNLKVFYFYLSDNQNIITAINNQVTTIINNGYQEIYLIGHNIGSTIALYIANEYEQIKKIIISNPIIYEKKLNFNLPKNIEKEIIQLNKECQNIITNIKCPILTIHGCRNNIINITNAFKIHDKITSELNYLVTIKNVDENIYTSNRYQEIYNIIIDFLTIKHVPNIFHLNI